MNKKGSERRLIYILAMSTLAFLVALGLFAGVRNFLQDTSYWKMYYARDLGLLMDASISGRGEMELNYDFSDAAKPLVLNFKDQVVEIHNYNPLVKKPIVTKFRFARDNNIPVTPTNLISQYFTILISNDYVRIVEETPKKEFCPEFDSTVNPRETTIAINYEQDPIIEELIRSGLSEFKVNNLPSKTDFSLILEEQAQGKLTVMYYYFEPKKSDKMGCLIRNQIIEDNEEITVSSNLNGDTIYFAELQRLSEDSKYVEEIKKSDLGLVIVAPKITNELAISITKGVLKYYGRSR